jgi:hypothetical protein
MCVGTGEEEREAEAEVGEEIAVTLGDALDETVEA